MAIRVICPGCKARFQVSDKFAGKRGPCPKCKAEINIPEKGEEVVVHAPEAFGPKDAKGRAVLKPIFREEPKFSPVIAGGIGAAVLAVLILALIFRFGIEDKSQFPTLILAAGAVILAPPLVLGGYTFLRDDELEPHRGRSLWIRVAICAALYAVTWGLLAMINSVVMDNDGFPLPMLLVVVPLMIGGGAGAAYVCLDLEFTNAAMHYGLYFLATVVLRLIVGIEALPMAQ